MANHAAAALLIAFLLVAVTLADARISMKEGNVVMTFAKSVPALTCNKVHGFQTGDTCLDVTQGAGLTEEQFLGFNPNINCVKVFVGQWVCLHASSA